MSNYKDPQELIVEAVRIGKNQTCKRVFAGSKIVFVLESLLLMRSVENLKNKSLKKNFIWGVADK